MPDMREYEVWAQTNVFRRRVTEAQRFLSKLTDSPKRWIVSSSWGKDSCALVGLFAETFGPGFDVVHLRSPYEMPGYESILDWASARCVIHTLDTAMDLAGYIDWLRENGLGYERETIVAADQGKQRKKDSMTEWVTARGYAAQVLGMRADESRARAKVLHRTRVYRARGTQMWCPLGRWTARDVWAYLVSRGIPWHRLYDCTTHGYTREQLRNAGWLSLSGWDDSRGAWLRAHFPEQWRKLATELPQVRRLT